MTFDKTVAQIPSLFTDRHCHVVYGLIRWLQPRVCLEVGSFQGFMSAWIAKAIQDNDNEGSLVCADDSSLTPNVPAILHNNLATLGLSGLVQIIPYDSLASMHIWPAQIDFAVIDGNHSIEYVEKEVAECVKRGAKCIVLHDTVGWWGPRDFLTMSGAKELNMIEANFDSGLAVLMVKEPKPPVTYAQESFPKGYVENGNQA